VVNLAGHLADVGSYGELENGLTPSPQNVKVDFCLFAKSSFQNVFLSFVSKLYFISFGLNRF